MELETLQAICMQIPRATESVKWDHNLVFAVGGKMFCITNLDGPLMFSVKVPPDSFEEWTLLPGIIPAPYLARAKWIQVQQPGNLSRSEIEDLIKESYRLVVAGLTRQMKKELGLDKQ
ncbi:hypothetical protein BUE76_12760 [Cnuella takakiae]|nr:hypothetical protein BUE76_12760 [Cnuella takakiae]